MQRLNIFDDKSLIIANFHGIINYHICHDFRLRCVESSFSLTKKKLRIKSNTDLFDFPEKLSSYKQSTTATKIAAVAETSIYTRSVHNK